MTTEPTTFTSEPQVLPEGLPLRFDGHLVSSDDEARGPGSPGYWAESFTTVRVLPSGVLDRVAGSVTMSENQVLEINQAAAIPVLRKVIRKEDRQRFEQLLNDEDRIVEYKVLWTAAMWAIKELAGNPTGGSGASPTG